MNYRSGAGTRNPGTSGVPRIGNTPPPSYSSKPKEINILEEEIKVEYLIKSLLKRGFTLSEIKGLLHGK